MRSGSAHEWAADLSAILVEETANGPAVMNTLKQRIPRIIGVKPLGGTQARAQAPSPTVEGEVRLPNPYMPGRLDPERAWCWILTTRAVRSRMARMMMTWTRAPSSWRGGSRTRPRTPSSRRRVVIARQACGGHRGREILADDLDV
jgi:hypothetical protein